MTQPTDHPPAGADPVAEDPATGQLLELRILSGMHQDARCPARHDALIGAHPDCDIVLAEPGLPEQAVRLKLGPAGWGLSQDPQGPALANDPAIPYNQPLSLGSIWVTVAHPSDPWPSAPLPVPEESGEPEPAPPDDPPAAPDPVEVSFHPDSDAPAMTAQADPSPAPAQAQPRHRSKGARAGLIVLVVAVATAVLMAGLMPLNTPASPPKPDPRLAIEQSIGKITAMIEQLGLTSRLHVAITPEGAVLVSGWVRNEDERNRLASALVQIGPMPAMRVSSEAEALSTADQVLKGFGVKYESRYEGDGRLSVAGIASDPEARSMALEAVRSELPGMTIMGNGILLATEVAQELSRELAAAGLGAVALVWQRHQLQVSTDMLDAAQMGTAQIVLDRFNQSRFDVAALAQSDKPYADAVPFKIRSVVSGETPFLVLDNGTKLLVGGTHQHYRLTKIDERQLIFEGPRPAIVLR
ncbi:type III secretion system inner membrane ring subunit SctD [Alcaligenes sp. Marseille-Q7550]